MSSLNYVGANETKLKSALGEWLGRPYIVEGHFRSLKSLFD